MKRELHNSDGEFFRGIRAGGRNFLPLVLVLVLCCGVQLFGQGLVGIWVAPAYKVSLQLAADGTYRLQHPNGQSQGRFSLNGQTLCFRDAAGGAVTCYTVAGFNGNALALRDVNGAVFNYQRQVASPGSTPVAPAGKRANEIPAAQVLGRQGNLVLSGSHFNAGIGLVQFIIGQSVKSSEAAELKSKLMEEFNVAPGEVLRQLNSISQSLQRIRTVTDPFRIGLARQELFSALYRATAQMREDQKPLMIRVMNRYFKVLAVDAVNNLLLTDKDAEGMMRYLAFNSELMGRRIALTPQLLHSVTADMVAKFNSMPLETKRILCSAGLLWKVMETNWNRLTAAQKQQYFNAYRTQMAGNLQPAPTQTPQTNYGSGNNASSSKSVTQQMMDFQAKQNMFTMMNNMNLNSHATSLNIIENMGGTGNYWEVVDY
ncbi:MAG: hypothetical protein GY765_41060 [bacterium]|nr:hypothetical protein [bacterium]